MLISCASAKLEVTFSVSSLSSFGAFKGSLQPLLASFVTPLRKLTGAGIPGPTHLEAGKMDEQDCRSEILLIDPAALQD